MGWGHRLGMLLALRAGSCRCHPKIPFSDGAGDTQHGDHALLSWVQFAAPAKRNLFLYYNGCS